MPITGRSVVEMEMTAHILEALYRALYRKQGASLQSFWNALRMGDELERTDAVFELASAFTIMYSCSSGTADSTTLTTY